MRYEITGVTKNGKTVTYTISGSHNIQKGWRIAAYDESDTNTEDNVVGFGTPKHQSAPGNEYLIVSNVVGNDITVVFDIAPTFTIPGSVNGYLDAQQFTAYENTAAGIIRSYIWYNLKQDGILNENDYIADGFTKPLIPLIPVSDVPQFKNLLPGAPYIIWDFSINGYTEDFWICEEEMDFSIIHNDRNKIIQITMYLVDLLRRMDITAKELEEFEYNSLLDENNNLVSEPKFNFHSVYINNLNNTPEIDEGDILIGEVWIRYTYSRRIGDNLRFV